LQPLPDAGKPIGVRSVPPRVLDPAPTRVEPDPAENDAALIRGTLAGRRADFDALVERHQKALYAFAFRFVHDHEQAADIVQTTFLQAYTHLAQFSGRSSFKTWLHQIALNECRQLRRSNRGREQVPLQNVHEADLPAITGPADSSVGLKGLLERLIARLPLRQRAVLTLRVFSDLPFKDIARIEGTTENSAKVSYHHAITRLRRWLGENQT
jgi:RNA polymerase sigma-70 factor, ECF subfamily